MKIVIMKNINLSQSVKVCGILYNKIYAINKIYTFTNRIRISIDNIIKIKNKLITNKYRNYVKCIKIKKICSETITSW